MMKGINQTTGDDPRPPTDYRALCVYSHSSQSMGELADESIHLIVTSPPYPMIEMWDAQFTSQDAAIGEALKAGDGTRAFERMHALLDPVWDECFRVLAPGCFLCVNIGDATRTLGGEFELYSNHTRITEACRAIGFTVLPLILWRKTTNAPNKFLGSGMFPAGAYVTLEHEYILIFRKGGKRQFRTPEEKKRRQESAFFWEERNRWFVDLWDLKGVRQELGREGSGRASFERPARNKLSEDETGVPFERRPSNDGGTGRSRSAAFPLELAWRLILMYSVKGDWVLDPFLGTGTTLVSAAITGRNGVGYEVDRTLVEEARKNILSSLDLGKKFFEDRLNAHREFLSQRLEQTNTGHEKSDPIGVLRSSSPRASKGSRNTYYWNENLGVPVVTRQETKISWERVKGMIEEKPPGDTKNDTPGVYSFQVITEPFTSEIRVP